MKKAPRHAWPSGPAPRFTIEHVYLTEVCDEPEAYFTMTRPAMVVDDVPIPATYDLHISLERAACG